MTRWLVLLFVITLVACISASPRVRAPALADATRTSPPSPDAASEPPHGAEPDVARADDRCAPTMFTDHVAGTHGLWSFEDASGEYGFRDARGRVVIPPRFRFAYEFSPSGVTAGVDRDGTPVFIDDSGRVLATAFFFDNGPDYFVGSMARIVKDGKVGFIDERGHIAIPPRWDYAASFCEGLAPVCQGCSHGVGDERDVFSGGSWGYIDTYGRLAIPLAFDEAGAFRGGTAEVVRQGHRERIDRDGHVQARDD